MTGATAEESIWRVVSGQRFFGCLSVSIASVPLLHAQVILL